MDGNVNTALYDNPTTWIKRDFERWKRKGKPTGSTAVPATGTNPTVSTTITTTIAEKQQKIDDNKLQVSNRGTKIAKDYPVLENDEYYTEWKTKMERQIKLEGWDRLIDDTFDTKLLRS